MDWIVDVVIPTFRPDERLLQILESLKTQTVRPRCVRLINTQKSGLDALLSAHGLTADALTGQYPFLEITHIAQEEFDHGGTRNRGFLRCTGADFVLTMTQDALPAGEDLIAQLLGAFAHGTGPQAGDAACGPASVSPGDAASAAPKEGAGECGAGETIAVAYARQLPNADAPVEEKLSRGFNYPAQPRIKRESDRGELGIKVYYCSNVCAMYRMDIWKSLGGFPDRAIFNEDMIYAWKALRAGYCTFYAAKAQVYHSHRYTAAQQFHRNFDLGVSQAQNPEVFGGLSSEGEGVSYVKAVVRQMFAEHAALQVPGFLARCAARLAGYRLGKAYERLPQGLVIRFSSNRTYWKS